MSLERGVIQVDTRAFADDAPELRVISDDELAGEFARLVRIAVLLCRDPVSAEDFAAEAISRALGRRRAAPIESFRPYLRRVLVNLILRHERRIATESRATVRGWSRPAEDEPAGIVVARNEISRALDRLSLDQRAVVVLRYLEDMSLLEVADVLRIPVGTVESRASRAMATLRSVLTEGDRHG